MTSDAGFLVTHHSSLLTKHFSLLLPYLTGTTTVAVLSVRSDSVKPTPVPRVAVIVYWPGARPAGTVGTGRDHNRYGFSCWLAGGGLRPGTAYGATDEVGWKAAESPVTWPDFHATVLHLFGLDHERLTFYHNGTQRRLTNVHGHVVKGVLA